MSREGKSLADVERWFQEQLKASWPVALGSLSLRRSPCVRKNCHACQTGEQHPSYVLYGRIRGQRFARYVPDDLATDVTRALENGRRLQAMLYEAGTRYLQALKNERSRKRSAR